MGIYNIFQEVDSEPCKMYGKCDMLLKATVGKADDLEGLVDFHRTWT